MRLLVRPVIRTLETNQVRDADFVGGCNSDSLVIFPPGDESGPSDRQYRNEICTQGARSEASAAKFPPIWCFVP